jgi:hypothetical protein
MLTSVESLVKTTDGRYASDHELMFLLQYLISASLRLRAYQKIQEAEPAIIAQVMEQLKSQKPDVFLIGGQDLSAKWQRDTVKVLRYSAMALLLDDPDRFKEAMLLWFKTIMRAFGAQESCRLTYAAMQEVMPQYLNAEEMKLFQPILELSQVTLGQ